MSDVTVREMVYNVQRWAGERKMESPVVVWLSVVSDVLVQCVEKKIVKEGTSQFQNLCVNFVKLHALFSTRLSQLG
jgi:hypothetical protein